ncbi:hypothetical protein [Myxacorys almedinensis]
MLQPAPTAEMVVDRNRFPSINLINSINDWISE